MDKNGEGGRVRGPQKVQGCNTSLLQVANGQEPSHTHDMDDDEIDEMEELETNSDQSN